LFIKLPLYLGSVKQSKLNRFSEIHTKAKTSLLLESRARYSRPEGKQVFWAIHRKTFFSSEFCFIHYVSFFLIVMIARYYLNLKEKGRPFSCYIKLILLPPVDVYVMTCCSIWQIQAFIASCQIFVRLYVPSSVTIRLSSYIYCNSISNFHKYNGKINEEFGSFNELVFL
jgi:hypothetical protein